MPQVDPGAHDPGAVLHRRAHAVRDLRFRLAAAPALHRQHLVLGRHCLDRRDVDDLPALDRGDRRFFRDFPQQPHLAGRCRTSCPGGPTSSIVAPGWPFGLPGLRPDLPRSDFGDGFASPSDDGGFDEFREFAFTCAARSATCDCSKASCSRSAAFSAACSSIWRPARPAAPAAACSQREARHHRCRERRASRARLNVATTPPGPQIGRHRSGCTERESAGGERTGQTGLSSY